jgi:phosphohistidine phosphatase
VDRLRTGFPTSAVAVLSITGDWSEIDHGRGALRDVVVPR